MASNQITHQVLGAEKQLNDSQACRCCGGQLEGFFTPVSDSAMTSDGQPFEHSAPVLKCGCCGLLQKYVNDTWLKNIGRIYTDYSSQNIAEGQDAIVEGQPRSEVILRNISSVLPRNGTLLDIGTGSGVFLKAAKKTTELGLCAQDINNNHEQQLCELGIERAYFGPLDGINSKFDVITAMHVIEHVVDTDAFYLQLRQLLTPEGIFIAQVPQSNENIFDLLIYDHLFHFNHATVAKLLGKFFKHVYFPKQIFKEITVICSNSSLPIPQSTELDAALPDIQRIYRIVNEAKKCDELAVFGSGPNSVYVANLLGNSAVYIVDDDPYKVGKKLAGKPIISSKQLAQSMPVVIPFPEKQVKTISSRWNNKHVIS